MASYYLNQVAVGAVAPDGGQAGECGVFGVESDGGQLVEGLARAVA